MGKTGKWSEWTALTFSASVIQAPLQFHRLTADICSGDSGATPPTLSSPANGTRHEKLTACEVIASRDVWDCSGPDTLSLSDHCLRWQWIWRSKSTWKRACCWDPNRWYPIQKNGKFDKDTEQEPEAEMTHCFSGRLFTLEWKQL